MTMRKPSLLLQRLVVLKSSAILYDQSFHRGLNIIRGDNSSGKSTIADFIFFALGGDLHTWTPEASAADSAHAEVAINGTAYTLSREVEPGTHPPLYIYEGMLEDAMGSREAWLRYPYSRSSNTQSFSQILFGLLGLPELRTEALQNITMHQLLRLVYVDQITAVDEIFRHERFDSRDTRIAVGELLLGIDDLEMHDVRLRLRDAEKSFSQVAGELRSMFRILGKTDYSNTTIINYQEQIAETQTEQEEIRRTVEQLAYRRDDEASSKADVHVREMAKELRNIKGSISDLRSESRPRRSI